MKFDRIRRYRVKLKNGMQGRVEDCLDRLDFDVDGVISQAERGDGRTVLSVVGRSDMSPSELQRELRDMGCLKVAVKDGYSDARDVSGPEVNLPDDGVDYAAEPVGSDADFDVDVARQALDRAGELLDVGGATNSRVDFEGDADRDRRWNANLGRQSYDEYIDHVVKRLVDEVGLGRDAARETVERCIRRLVASGSLPERPDERDPDNAYARWVGAAKGHDLGGHCVNHARGEG